jgi:uncharacterized protein (DUF433 family)
MKVTLTNYDRITVDPEQMNGQPCIRGMRMTIKRVLEALVVYPEWEEFRREYPELDHEDIRQALAFAADSLNDSVLIMDIAA